MSGEVRNAVGAGTDPGWQDLSHAIAVIAPAPGFLYPRGGQPTSDGRWVEAPDDTAARFEPLFRILLEDVAQSDFRGIPMPAELTAPPRYHFGPYGTGGMYEQVNYLLLFVPDVQRWAEVATTWGTLAEWALGRKKFWRDLLRRFRVGGADPNERDQLVFTAPIIQAVCLAHAQEQYSPFSKFRVASYVRHHMHGTASHPSGEERYTVRIAAGKRAYYYVVNGRLTPFEHFTTEGKRLEPLPLPDFFDYLDDLSPGTGQVTIFDEIKGTSDAS